jgi:hypothetical protein
MYLSLPQCEVQEILLLPRKVAAFRLFTSRPEGTDLLGYTICAMEPAISLCTEKTRGWPVIENENEAASVLVGNKLDSPCFSLRKGDRSIQLSSHPSRQSQHHPPLPPRQFRGGHPDIVASKHELYKEAPQLSRLCRRCRGVGSVLDNCSYDYNIPCIAAQKELA